MWETEKDAAKDTEIALRLSRYSAGGGHLLNHLTNWTQAKQSLVAGEAGCKALLQAAPKDSIEWMLPLFRENMINSYAKMLIEYTKFCRDVEDGLFELTRSINSDEPPNGDAPSIDNQKVCQTLLFELVKTDSAESIEMSIIEPLAKEAVDARILELTRAITGKDA